MAETAQMTLLSVRCRTCGRIETREINGVAAIPAMMVSFEGWALGNDGFRYCPACAGAKP